MAAIQEYTDALAKRTQQFLNILEKRQGMNVDVSGWLSCLSLVFTFHQVSRGHVDIY